MSKATLTEIESLGLQSQFNFADGHAYQDLTLPQRAIVARLDQLWLESASRKVKDSEWLYQEAFTALSESPSLKAYPHFWICPTASNSIDLVAAWLNDQKMSVTLLEPTFDNLFLLLKRRGVPISSLDEIQLHEEGVASTLEAVKTDAIFLVNPNNPTGRTLSKDQFCEIVQHCVSHRKTLLLDNTFRFFVKPEFDQYQILIDSGVTFLSIEDTGKVWPTQDMKASLVFSSKNLAPAFGVIYEEVYLCVSPFTLGILTEFLKNAKQQGLQSSVWSEVESRRNFFRTALQGTPLAVDRVAQNSKLSVEWVHIESTFQDDYDILDYFKAQGLMLLPGRNFYWNRPSESQPTQNIRFSLLKPRAHFLNAVEALRAGLLLASKGARHDC